MVLEMCILVVGYSRMAGPVKIYDQSKNARDLICSRVGQLRRWRDQVLIVGGVVSIRKT